jgi:hypothetical protein
MTPAGFWTEAWVPDFAGFIGDAYTAPSATQDTQDTVNWFPEIDPTKKPGDLGRIALYPTPGLTAPYLALPTFPVRGMKVLAGGQTLLAVAGNVLYSIDTGYHSSAIGNLETSYGPVSIADNGISAMIVDGPARYYYNYNSSPPGYGALYPGFTTPASGFGVMPSTDGPFNGGTIVDVVDNYFVYPQPSSNLWGCSGILTPFSPELSLGQKFGYSDNIVSLIVCGREVFLIGEQTTEPWIDVGSFPFPFQIIPGTNTQHGCAAPLSVARFGEAFAFVAQDSRGQGVIVQMIGYNIKRISTHSVENDLVGQVIKDAIAYTYQLEGHEFYVVTFPTADKTWVYDLATGMWHKWRSIDSYGVLHRHRSNCMAVFNGLNLVGDYQNGNIYALSNTTYTDNGATIKRVRRAPHLVKDYQRVNYEELQVMFQPGIGLVNAGYSGAGTVPKAMLKWSDDGGITFGNEHWQSIGVTGAYKNRARWTQMGSARDRIYELTVTDPVKAVPVSANIRASAGAW